MKKILPVLLSILLLGVTGITAGAKAAEQVLVRETMEYFEDGSYATISVYEENALMAYADTYTKSGSKTYTLRDKNGAVQWTFTLKGTFQVNTGVSSTCTAASYTHTIKDSSWSLKSASATKSGNKAIGDATFQSKVLFIVTNTKSCHLELSCDKYGTLS